MPLMVASAKGSEDFVRVMLSNPTIDVNRKESFGINSFWIAANYGNSKIMHLLIEKGIDILCETKSDSVSSNGVNALHIAVKKRRVKVVRYLIEINFPLNNMTEMGLSALAIAAQRGYLDILRILLQAGANVNRTSPEGIGALYMAIKGRHYECVELLLKYGCEIFYKNKIKREVSPVFYAVSL